MSEPWFGAKDHGFGSGPKSGAGWISTIIYIAAMVATGPIVRHFALPLGTVGLVHMGLSVGFLVLMLAKSSGRPWRWRWGQRER